MRRIPRLEYEALPCAYVATGCAYEDIFKKNFEEPMLDELRDDGWSTLDNTNKYIRRLLPVQKKVYYKRSERMTLGAFLADNAKRCIVCVYGHFIYVNEQDYWSFFENEDDEVVCIWYLKE